MRRPVVVTGVREEAKMSDRKENRKDNDALQSGEGRPALGQSESDFGAGGQTVTDTQGEGSPRDREVERGSTVTSDQRPRGDD
jgi:hypothetical protein